VSDLLPFELTLSDERFDLDDFDDFRDALFA
jgi:hypothetical protein